MKIHFDAWESRFNALQQKYIEEGITERVLLLEAWKPWSKGRSGENGLTPPFWSSSTFPILYGPDWEAADRSWWRAHGFTEILALEMEVSDDFYDKLPPL